MKFQMYVRTAKKNSSDIRLVHRIINGNHDFPSSSSKGSLDMFCKKHQFTEHVQSAFNRVWSDFERCPYATVANRKKEN